MISKRTFEEFLLIYELEKSLVDLFCEGPSDRLILKSFAEATSSNTTAVYSADQIEWPEAAGSYGGHRAKVIYLSQALASKRLKGICVIDRDLDAIEDRCPANQNLLKTDFASLDIYGLDAEDMHTLVYTRFNIDISAQELGRIFEACRHLFAIRFLREEFCKGSSIASAYEILTDAVSISFSADRYLQRCRQINGYDPRWDRVVEGHHELLGRMAGDFRDYINVHDLGEILAIIIRQRKGRTVRVDADFVAKHFAYVLLSKQKFDFALFSDISRRLIG